MAADHIIFLLPAIQGSPKSNTKKAITFLQHLATAGGVTPMTDLFLGPHLDRQASPGVCVWPCGHNYSHLQPHDGTVQEENPSPGEEKGPMPAQSLPENSGLSFLTSTLTRYIKSLRKNNCFLDLEISPHSASIYFSLNANGATLSLRMATLKSLET